MRDGIYKPCNVPYHCDAQEEPPNENGEPRRSSGQRGPKDATDGKKEKIEVHEVPLQESMNWIRPEIRSQPRQFLGIPEVGVFEKIPHHMCPEDPVLWRMRVPFSISGLMMKPMCRNPPNRAAFQAKTRYHCEEIFQVSVCLEASVSQEAVISENKTERECHISK